jgi:hypothetical protein
MSDLLRTIATYYDQSLPPGILGPPVTPPPASAATEVPGGPGDFLPSGCETPTVAQLSTNPVVANPLTAWSTGSHMACTDGNAFWDGTAWAPGIAADPPLRQAGAAQPPAQRRNHHAQPKPGTPGT